MCWLQPWPCILLVSFYNTISLAKRKMQGLIFFNSVALIPSKFQVLNIQVVHCMTYSEISYCFINPKRVWHVLMSWLKALHQCHWKGSEHTTLCTSLEAPPLSTGGDGGTVTSGWPCVSHPTAPLCTTHIAGPGVPFPLLCPAHTIHQQPGTPAPIILCSILPRWPPWLPALFYQHCTAPFPPLLGRT